MQFWHKLRTLLGGQRRTRLSQTAILNALLSQARLTYYAENYPTALELLDEAERIATSRQWTLPLTEIAFERANVLRLQGSYRDAEILLNTLKTRAEAQQIRPVIAYALCHLALLEYEQGHYDAAQGRADRAHAIAQHIHAKGAKARAHGLRGMIALAQGSSVYAENALTKAIQQMLATNDQDLLPRFQGELARAYHANGKHAQSHALFHTAIQNAAGRQDVYTLRKLSLAAAACAYASNDHDRARHHYQNVLGLFAKYNPNNPDHVHDSLIAHAHLARLTGKRDHAEHARMLALHTVVTPAEHALAQHAYGAVTGSLDALQAALLYYQAQNAAQAALAVLRDLARLAPTPDEQHAYLQEAHAYAQATGDKAQLGAIEAALGDWHAEQGERAAALNAWQRAAANYRAAYQHAPLLALYCAIADTYEVTGQPQRALKAYDEALLYLGDAPNTPQKARLLGEIARVYAEKGDVTSAEAFYGDALALTVAEERLYITLEGERAWLQVQSSRPAQGIATLTRTQAQARTQGWHDLAAQHADWLGVGYALLGEHDTALTYHQEALAETDKSPALACACHLHIAQTLHLRAAHAQACQHIERAYALARLAAQPALLAEAAQAQARCALLRHDTQAARAALDAARVALTNTYSKRLRATQYHLESQYHAQTGDHAQARAAWEQANALYTLLRAATPRPFWLDDAP